MNMMETVPDLVKLNIGPSRTFSTKSIEFREECCGLEVDQGEQDEDKEERNSGVLSPDLVKL